MTISITAGHDRSPTLDLAPDRTATARRAMVLRDFAEAMVLWRLCWTLSWLDIKLRYRGSTLGPLWLTLSTAVMVGALGFVNSALFGMSVRDYLPFLALSLVLWGFIGSLVGDACISFTAVEGMVRSVRMPFSLYAARIVLRNILVLAHNILVIVVVDVLLGAYPGWTGLLAIPAFALWLVDGFAVSLLFGAICARFRDIPPIVGSIMQMAFFISAIIWKPEQLGPSQWWLPFNPFFSLLDTVRGPLMGTVPTPATYLSAVGYSVLLCVVAWSLFVRVRARIAFWI